MDSSVSPKDEIWFLRVCHHISKAVNFPGIFLEELKKTKIIFRIVYVLDEIRSGHPPK